MTKSSLVENGACRPALDHLRGETPRAWLVAKLLEDLGEFLRRGLVEQVGGHRAGARHPHIQRRATPKREPERLVVELPRRDAEIEQDEVGPERGDGVERLG